jgi:hypothetical protein
VTSSKFCLQVIFSFSLCVGIFTTQSTQADDLSGLDDPAFQAAIEVWLDDNDADSLPAFATLASEGNIAARLLLTRIQNTDWAPSNYLNGLSREEKIEIFRPAGEGLFRPSWLKSEKQAGNQLAAALLEAPALEVNIDAIRTLYEFGEPEASYDLIKQVATNGSQNEKDELAEFLPKTSELAPFLQALQFPEENLTPGHAALQHILSGDETNQTEGVLVGSEQVISAAAVFVEFGYENGFHSIKFDQDNAFYSDLASWINTAPAAVPIAAVCNQYCTDGDMEACVITIFGLVGGYYKAVRFDSPIEKLIEQSRFLSSNRAAGMVLRRGAFKIDVTGKLLMSESDLRDKAECLAEAVVEARASRN